LRWLSSPIYRFAFVLPLALGVIITALFVPLYNEAVSDIRKEVDSAVELEIVGLAGQSRAQGLEGLIRSIKRRVAEPIDDDAVYLLADAVGNRIVGNLTAWPHDVSASNDGSFQITEADGSAVRGQVIVLDDGKQLLVGRRSPQRSFSSHTFRRWMIAGVVATFFSALLAWLFARSIQRRLNELASGAERVQQGTLSRRLPIYTRGDGLDLLAERFNTAFARIEQLTAAARDVSSAIAHDMRRPLTRLRNEIEALRREKNNDVVLVSKLDRLLEHTDNVLRSFAALLRLARLESGSLEAERKAVELDIVAKDVAELFEPIAEAAGRHLRLQWQKAIVLGDRELLFQAFINIVENALQYGRGDIDFHVSVGDRKITSVVRDHGDGVPSDALPRLFERFFRVDTSRTSANGSGVGLALVAAIAEFHGGRVVAENAHPGLRITMILPASVKSTREEIRNGG
ncbi:MAG TPA: ATP-binding protein, partial [Rhodocyclaceae bacterium]|nr:ATP-binding protein [Rhodocyclaceae bacterium]